VGINEQYSLECDWCGLGPELGLTFSEYIEAYQEMTRVARYEGWLLRKDGKFFCPDCVAEGRAKG
jgi:hypothetical protein